MNLKLIKERLISIRDNDTQAYINMRNSDNENERLLSGFYMGSATRAGMVVNIIDDDDDKINELESQLEALAEICSALNDEWHEYAMNIVDRIMKIKETELNRIKALKKYKQHEPTK